MDELVGHSPHVTEWPGRLVHVAKDISVLEAAQLVADEGAVLLDVREADEWAAVRAPGALHIPMRQLSTSTDRLPMSGLLVCICHIGARSAVVADALVGAGAVVGGGVAGDQAWERAGLPVERG